MSGIGVFCHSKRTGHSVFSRFVPTRKTIYKLIVMTTAEILSNTSAKMTKCIAAVEHQFSGVRTTKASPALIEGVEVEAYGNVMRIKEVATITTPEPRVLMIQPWDAGTVKAIEKAIAKRDRKSVV